MFKSTMTSFLKYIPFISLLRRIGFDLKNLYELVEQFDSCCILKPKYLIFKEFFIKKSNVNDFIYSVAIT